MKISRELCWVVPLLVVLFTPGDLWLRVVLGVVAIPIMVGLVMLSAYLRVMWVARR